MPDLDPLLETQGLHVAYNGFTVVKGVDLTLWPGEVLALVGESGSGKSTTAHAILGLLPKDAAISAGKIRFQGEDITNPTQRRLRALRGRQIGLVPQDPTISLNPVLRIGNQVAEVLRIHGLANRYAASARAVELLDIVGISDPDVRAQQYPHQLSGGMRQRVLIAIALACDPRLVVADEPTSALDVTVQARVLDYMMDLTRKAGTAMIFITHDLGVAAERADRIAVMRDGKIVETGPAHGVIRNPQHEYTRLLIDAAPGLTRHVPARPKVAETSIPRLELRSISRRFALPGSKILNAVSELSLRIPRGQTYGLVGESGSGKTTTARIAAHFEIPDQGQIFFDGEDVTRLSTHRQRAFRKRVQYVHQNPYHSLDPRFTIAEILTEPLRAFGIGTGAERHAKAVGLMTDVALDPAWLDRYPKQLSGGQRQRVAIARALALEPDLIVLDEPVSALDVLVQRQILALLDRLQRERDLTYLFISHDLSVVRNISDRVGVMQGGRLIETGSTAAVFADPKTPYTRQLIGAIPGQSLR